MPLNLLLPMKLDAFVFNSQVCDGGPNQAKIAPITQPNYTFLQLKDHLVQNDILDHVDLHNSSPATRNPRHTDIGKATVRQNRLGVYVHWSLPRPLRSGIAATDSTPGESAPRYHAIPNRWLVIRSFDPAASTTVPQSPPGMKPVTAWIIESDKTNNIDDLPASVDVEVDVAPFVTSFIEKGKTAADISVEQQAEVFIGSCTEASVWDSKDQLKPGEVRVGLSAASSSNQLFIDYQYHCGNVLSMLDTFPYRAKDGSTKQLESVVADYYVVGWHNDPAKDIMNPQRDGQQSRGAQLDALRVMVEQTAPATEKDAIKNWLEQAGSARTLCHGAMYEVAWKVDKAPDKRPADDVAQAMSRMPFSVGTTPMDAILAYLAERTPTGEVESGILALQALLRAEDDGVDAQIAAEDELQTYNYANLDGGDHFYLPAQEGKKAGAAPSVDEQREIRHKNNAQHLLDSTLRRIQQLRWEVFSWWWKFISDVDNAQALKQTKSIDTIQNEITILKAMVRDLQAYIGEPKAPIKKGVMETFHQRNDPTLLISGAEAGWPTDFNETLRGRLDNQIMDTAVPPPAEAYADCIPPDLQDAGRRLVQEFFSLKDAKVPSSNPLSPLYHDGKRPNDPANEDQNPWRDRWANSQPWFPLYVEWEAEYAHVGYEHWELKKRPARTGLASKVTYVLKDDIRIKPPGGAFKDVRYVSGRSLLLPQPALSLKVHIGRLFATVPPSELDLILDAEKREKIMAKLDQLAFLSLPLAGLTDHLTTRYQGSHVKPLVRQPGSAPVVLEEAKQVIAPAKVDLSLIEQESDPTPYGSLPTLLGQHIAGFKPVTHGQLRFTKINMVDKFGQVVHAIDPIPEATAPVYPSVSETFAIDAVPGHDSEPNVVDGSRSTLARTEYIQLTPAVNQPARLNAHFVVRDEDSDDSNDWRPATEFDKPIWGWVVVNYVNRGLQFFLPDGTFYREIRSTASDIKWLPFDEPPTPSKNYQLDALIGRLVGSDKYLKAFMDMIMSALGATVPTPSAYSQFLTSLVGRPLALANMGWSLELNTESLKNQSTLQEQRNAKLDWGLLPGDGERQYDFAIKFGDATNNYDGLVGYFHATEINNPSKPKSGVTVNQDDGNDLILDNIYTYFHSKYDLDGSPLTPIDNTTHPRLPAYWIDPKKYQPRNQGQVIDEMARRFDRERNRQLHIFGAVFDPFAPITAFTSILPMRALSLPTWSWETALKRITAFFHAGPLLLTDDVPPFNAEHRLEQTEQGGYDPGQTVPGTQLSMPALRTADWAWLQPYDLGSTSDPQGYMSLDVVGDADEKPQWKRGPMTAVEGFMQLKGPIEQGGN